MTGDDTRRLLHRPFLDLGAPAGPVPAWPLNAAQNVIVALAYLATGYAGLRLAFVGESVTLFWPPSGIAFAALWMGGRRLAPGVAVGAFLVNLITMKRPEFALLVALGNVLPSLAGAHVLRRLLEGRPKAGELQRVLWFILVGALGATTLSATVGTLTVGLLGHIGTSIQSTWLVWWMGDAMGVLIVAPPILLWRRILSNHRWRSILDAIAFAGAGFAIIAGLALIHNPIWAVELCKLFTLLLSLWAGARFGLTGPAAMTLLMALGAIGVTAFGVGPFVRGNFYDSFALVHSYLFAEAVAGMLLAAALADLERTAARERQALGEVEAASANRVRLLTMISHDVRTPLSGMTGVLQALQTSSLTDGDRRLVGLGLRAGSNITKLVTDILDVARADAGRITLDPAPFSPAQSLRDIADIHRDPAEAKGLALRLDIDPALPAAVTGDRVRFEQLIGNLVTNAIAYTAEGGVTVTARWADAVDISVEDTGPGIDGDAGNIFDAFGLAPRPGNRSASLGLGLHICQRLAELMGGTIAYRRGITGGSSFQVHLPLPAAPAASLPQAPVAEAEPPLTILLVEDDEIARETTLALLERHGHHVIAADSGEAALATARSRDFDLVLMDVQLHPDGMPGTEAARAIRALGAAPLILALTGDGNEDSHAEYLAAGMDGVLVKPLSLATGMAGLVAAAREKSHSR